MTKFLEQAIAIVRGLPENRQGTLPRLLMQFAGIDQPALELSEEEIASFDESAAKAERGEFASDEQIEDIWAKHGVSVIPGRA
jgi:hypothetical protein